MITGRNELDEREIRAVRRGYRFTRTFYSWQVFMPLGRVGRKRYWLAMLGLWLPIVVFLLLVDPLDRWLSQEAIRASRDTVQVIFFTYLVLILIPSFSLTVRRYHDVNYPGVKCALILPFYIVCWPLFMLMRLWWSWIKPVQIAVQREGFLNEYARYKVLSPSRWRWYIGALFRASIKQDNPFGPVPAKKLQDDPGFRKYAIRYLAQKGYIDWQTSKELDPMETLEILIDYGLVKIGS